jgi:iron(III) transport system substrate-binding protein
MSGSGKSKISARSAIALGAVAVLALSGCAVGTGSTASPGGGTSEPADAATIVQASEYATIYPAIIAAAKKEQGTLVMYDSTPDEKAKELLAAFQAEFPFVKGTSHVLLRAAEVSTRVLQESQAGVPTADVVITGGPALLDLSDRGLLRSADFEAAGIPEPLIANDEMVATAASTYVLVYNSDLVDKADAPQGWDDLLDPKWAGEIALMSDPLPIAQLVPVLGGDKVNELWDGIMGQNPVLMQDTIAVANAVGAGEVSIGIGHWHASQPAIAGGAPVEIVFPEPVALSLLFSAMPTKGASPATAELFVAWLATEAGAELNEKISNRGNPFLPGTKAADLLKGRQISAFEPEDAADLSRWLTELSR